MGGARKHMKSLWVSKGWALRGKLEIAGGCFSRVRAVWYGPGAPRVTANRWLLFLSGAGGLMREWVRARARARAFGCVCLLKNTKNFRFALRAKGEVNRSFCQPARAHGRGFTREGERNCMSSAILACLLGSAF